MQPKDELGKLGEALAEKYLDERGYEVIDRNWRHSHFELDLIAIKDDVLHFIEVKTRKTTAFGLPEEAVDEIKINCLVQAGEEFLYQYPYWTWIQFDVLSICMLPHEEIEYLFIEDVYF